MCIGGRSGLTTDRACGWSGSRDGAIFYKRSGSLGQGWGTRRRLSRNTSYSIYPNIDSNGNRRLGIAWADLESGIFQIQFRKSYNRGNSWYSRNIVSDSPVGAWQPDLAWSRNSSDVHLVWWDYRDGEGELYYSYYNGSSWSIEERLTYASGSVNQRCFAIGENGNAFIVWEEIAASGTSMGMGQLVSP